MSAPNDYTREPVPDHATVGWYKITLVTLGIGITLPVFLVGSELTLARGLSGVLGVFALTSLIVGVPLAITSVIGARTRLSTYMILEFSFGRRGALAVNAIMAFVLIAWFAFTADILGAAIQAALLAQYGIDLPTAAYTITGGVLMTLTALFGFHVMERFSQLAVPLLAVFMVYVVYLTLGREGAAASIAQAGSGSIGFGEAVSTVIGTNILIAVMAPDLTRFARNDREALKSIAGLVVGYPLVMLCSGIPALILGEPDLMQVMLGLGLSMIALVVLVLATWTTNTVNLYSSILTLSTLATRTPGWILGLGAAVVGLAATLGGLMQHFLPFVVWLGIFSTPVAGIYIADFFLAGRRGYRLEDLERRPAINVRAFSAWLAGSLVGYLTSEEKVTLSAVPAVDSVAVALLAYLALNFAAIRQRVNPLPAAASAPDTPAPPRKASAARECPGDSGTG